MPGRATEGGAYYHSNDCRTACRHMWSLPAQQRLPGSQLLEQHLVAVPEQPRQAGLQLRDSAVSLQRGHCHESEGCCEPRGMLQVQGGASLAGQLLLQAPAASTGAGHLHL